MYEIYTAIKSIHWKRQSKAAEAWLHRISQNVWIVFGCIWHSAAQQFHPQVCWSTQLVGIWLVQFPNHRIQLLHQESLARTIPKDTNASAVSWPWLPGKRWQTKGRTWESNGINLYLTVNIHPLFEALRSFLEPRPTFLPKTHVDTCCILETSRWSTLTWGQAEAKHIPGKIIGQEIKSTCSMRWSCGVRTQSEEKRSWDPWPCLVIHNHLCLCRYRSHPWNLHSKQLSKDVGIQMSIPEFFYSLWLNCIFQQFCSQHFPSISTYCNLLVVVLPIFTIFTPTEQFFA